MFVLGRGYVSDNKQLVDRRITLSRTTSTYAFAAITLGVLACAMLREADVLGPGLFGLALMLWIMSGFAAVIVRCAAYWCERDARYARRAEQIEHKFDQLMNEVTMVAEWTQSIEEEQYARRMDRN